MSQSKLRSAIEAGVNILIGAGITLGSQLLLFPMYDIHVPLSTDLWLTFWFTCISFVRSYLIRRFMQKGD